MKIRKILRYREFRKEIATTLHNEIEKSYYKTNLGLSSNYTRMASRWQTPHGYAEVKWNPIMFEEI